MFLYLEHETYDSKSRMRRVQRLFRGVWSALLDGCDITRDIAPRILDAGFSHVEQERFIAPYRHLVNVLAACPLMRPHLMGCATK